MSNNKEKKQNYKLTQKIMHVNWSKNHSIIEGIKK